MSVNPALPILLTLLVSLLPIAIYCLVLTWINRRSTPLMVHGAWDFAGVLFAVSGIILWTGPALLATLYQRSVASEAERSFESVWLQWWFIWAGYYTLATTGAIFLLWLRRSTTAIYNVRIDLVPLLIEAALRRLGYDFTHNAPRQFLIASARPPRTDAGAAAAAAAVEPHVGRRDDEAKPYCTALEVDAFAAMSHATLNWYETGTSLRDDIESELRQALVTAGATDNPAALWQSAAAFLLFGAVVLSVVFVVLSIVFPRH